MAITYVGGTTTTFAGGTGGSESVSLTGLTGGSNSSPSIGDLVVFTYVSGSTVDRALLVNTTGYVAAITEQYANGTSYDTNFAVYYKYLTAADTTISLNPTGNNADAGAVAVQVFRGVDSTSPMDVAGTVATGTGTGRPNPPQITPSKAGAWIVVCYGSAALTGAVYTAPSDVTNFRTATSADTQDAMVGMGIKTDWVSGAFDPAAISAGGTTNAADSWAAATLVLRPFVQNITAVPGAYALTGTPATLTVNRKIFADAGSYAVTGTAANLLKTYRLTADAGSYSQTTVPANTFWHHRSTLTPGSYSVSGTATTFLGRRITTTMVPGSYTQTGTPTTNQNRRITGTLTPGNFVLTGTADNQYRRITDTLTPGSYTQTGTATIKQLWNRRLTAVPGSYVHTGVNDNQYRKVLATLTPGSYTQTGINTDRHLIHRRLFATPGSYTQTGTATIAMARRIFLSTASGVYTYAVPDETYLPNYKPTLLLCI